MIGFIVYSIARQRTADEARAALPTSPVRPDHRTTSPRQRASVTLRRIADRLESASNRTAPTMADCR